MPYMIDLLVPIGILIFLSGFILVLQIASLKRQTRQLTTYVLHVHDLVRNNTPHLTPPATDTQTNTKNAPAFGITSDPYAAIRPPVPTAPSSSIAYRIQGSKAASPSAHEAGSAEPEQTPVDNSPQDASPESFHEKLTTSTAPEETATESASDTTMSSSASPEHADHDEYIKDDEPQPAQAYGFVQQGNNKPATPSLIERAWQYAMDHVVKAGNHVWDHGRRWLTTGNIPVKIGVLVLFLGIAALLKQLNVQEWISVSLPMRLAGIAVLAAIGLAFGWQQRHNRHNFALTLQGGMLGILAFTLFSAYRLYALLPSWVALSCGILLSSLMIALAVVQRARVLAQLAVLAGFSAPILLTVGEGHYVALFSYYALLDIAIFGIAWIRPWRELNLIGFTFTYGIGVTKGVLEYTPEHMYTCMPFLWLFFAIYLALPLMYAYRIPFRMRSTIDSTLIFGAPLVTLSLQSSMVLGSDIANAWLIIAPSTLVMTTIYATLSLLCLRRWGWRLMGELYAYIGAALITAAIPMMLGSDMTGCVYAIEGAGLVWLGFKEERLFSRLVGFALQLYAAANVISHIFSDNDVGVVLYLHALLITAATTACTWMYHRFDRLRVAQYLGRYTLLLWSSTHALAIIVLVPIEWWCSAGILMLLLTALAVTYIHPRLSLPIFLHTPSSLLLMCGVLLLPHLDSLYTLPELLSIAALFVGGVAILRAQRRNGMPKVLPQLIALWLLVACSLSLAGLNVSWNLSGIALLLAALPWLAVMAVTLYRFSWFTMEMQLKEDQDRKPWVIMLSASICALTGLSFLATIIPCGTYPLPWLPLLNPAEGMQLGMLLMIWHGWRVTSTTADYRQWLLMAGTAWLLNESLFHTMHHWVGIPWDRTTLLNANITQLSITLLWSLIGVLGWIYSSRQHNHTLWRIYAAIMGLVLAKLLVIDRLYLSSLSGILSFVTYGLLCVLIGFMAPIPPKKKKSPHNTTQQEQVLNQ